MLTNLRPFQEKDAYFMTADSPRHVDVHKGEGGLAPCGRMWTGGGGWSKTLFFVDVINGWPLSRFHTVPDIHSDKSAAEPMSSFISFIYRSYMLI
jgi:hypothetical protein